MELTKLLENQVVFCNTCYLAFELLFLQHRENKVTYPILIFNMPSKTFGIVATNAAK